MRKGILRPRLGLACVFLLAAFGCGRRLPTDPAPAPLAPLASSEPATQSTSMPVRAAYFYGYMPPSHLDSLARAGINRAVVKWIGDSLGTRENAELARLSLAASRLGIELLPAWTAQTRSRLSPGTRRYTWGAGTVEPDVACPLDSVYWRRVLLDRPLEFLRAQPSLGRLVVDLELYHGSRHHYDAGPCLCSACVVEFRSARGLGGADLGLAAYQEERLTRTFTSILGRLAGRRPGVELGVFDLDHASFVHAALGRALVRAGVPTTDYAERSYWMGGSNLAAARATLRQRGIDAPIIGGLWLAKVSPRRFPHLVRSMEGVAQGFFVFTTFSLWVDPAERTGAYRLLGTPEEYWSALSSVATEPSPMVAAPDRGRWPVDDLARD